MVNFQCVISSSSSRERFITNQAWIPETSDIHIVFLEIVIAPTFSSLLRNAVDSIRIHDTILGCLMAGAIRPEDRDRGRPVHLVELNVFGEFQNIQKAIHIDLPCQQRFFLSGCGKYSSQMVHLFYIFFFTKAFYAFPVHHIEGFKPAKIEFVLMGWIDVCSDNGLSSVKCSERSGQFGS